MKKNKQWGYLKAESGVAAIEFSFIAPILLLVCVGMLDFGLVTYEKMRLENMAQAAADYLINGGSDNNLQADVLDAYDSGSGGRAGSPSVTGPSVQIDLQCECSTGTEVNCSLANTCGDEVAGGYRRRFYSVTIDKEHQTLLPYGVIPQKINLQGSARVQLD